MDGGEPVEISADDLTIQRQEREGMTVANEGEITVALDTRLDEPLLREGWAREVVSRLQSMRKDADLEVADRIRVRYRVPAEAAEAVREFSDYIAAETLSVALAADEACAGEPVEINGKVCRFAIEKA